MKKVKTAISLFLLSAILMAGGSDGYGYTWSSSLEPGGPTYEWYDITGFSGPLSLSGDNAYINSVPLGFNFPYYGSTYNSIGISTNGFIAFGNIGDAAYTNQQLPDVGNAGNMLAIFWDDLDFTAGANKVWSYHDSANNRHIIEFWEVYSFATANKNTFQIMLYEDGTIVYQYQTMNGNLTSATVGWQNSNGSEGHTIIQDAPFLQSNMVIRIEYSDAPKGFYAATGDLKASLNWSASAATDLAGYYIYRGGAVDPTTAVDSIMGGTASVTYYLDTGLENDSTYYYRLRAKYSDGSFSEYSDNLAVVPSDFDINVDGNITDWADIRQIHNDPTGDQAWADIDSTKLNADGFYLYGAIVTSDALDNNNLDIYFDTDFNAGTGWQESDIGADYKLVISPWGSTELQFRNQFNNWESDGSADFSVNSTNSNRFHEFEIHLDELDSPDSLRFFIQTNSNDKAPDAGYLAYILDPNDAPRDLFVGTGDTKANLNWNASNSMGYSKYIVYRGTAVDPTTAISTIGGGNPLTSHYLDSGLTNGTTYYYRIRGQYADNTYSDYTESIAITPDMYAMNIDGNITDWANIRQIFNDATGDVGNTDIDSVKLYADDENLYGTVVTTTNLDWDEVLLYIDSDLNSGTGEGGNNLGADYQIRLSPFSNDLLREYNGNWQDNWDSDLTVVHANNNQFHEFRISLDHIGSPDSLRLYYKSNSNDYAPEDDYYLVINTARVALDAPTGLTALADSAQVTLRWAQNDTTGLAAYYVYRSTSSPVNIIEGNRIDTLLAQSPPDTFYTDDGLDNGTMYYYRVTALNGDNRESESSSEAMATPNVLHEQLVELLHTNTIQSPSSDRGYPFNTDSYDVRHQSIYLADDFSSAGIPANAWISAIDLKPTTVTGELVDFRLAGATTSLTELAAYQNLKSDVIYGPQYHNQSEFSDNEWFRFGVEPFQWNGTDNWVLEASQDADYWPSNSGGATLRETENSRGYRGWNEWGDQSYDNFSNMDNSWNENLVLAIRLTYALAEPVDSLDINPGHKSIDLSWVAPGTETVQHYIVYQGPSSDSLEAIGTTTATSYPVTGLINGETYYVGVQVVNTNGEYSGIISGQATPAWTGPRWYVDAAADGPAYEGSPDDPAKTIKAGISLAAEDDTVLVMPGRYNRSNDLNIRFAEDFGGGFYTAKNLVLKSQDPNDPAVLDGKGVYRVFEIRDANDTTAQVIGFHIVNGGGTSNGWGSAIQIGNGMESITSQILFRDCVIDSASGEAIAAVRLESGSKAWFVDCTIQDNENSSTVGGNVEGGAFLIDEGSELYLDKCQVLDNQVTTNGSHAKGAGVNLNWNTNNRLNAVNTVFAGNQVTSTDNWNATGAAVNIGQGEATLINCTLADNSSLQQGAAISADDNTKLSIFNSIVYGNSPDSDQILFNGTVNHSISYSIIHNENPAMFEEGVFDAVPGFASYSLHDGSPAIGAGAFTGFDVNETQLTAPAVDIEGNTRPTSGDFGPDLGAYENPLAVTPYPAPPVIIEVLPMHQSVRFHWNPSDSADVVKYYVYQSNDSTNWVAVDTTLGYATEPITISGLTNKLPYYFAVSAVDGDDYESSWSYSSQVIPAYMGPVWYVDVDADGPLFEGSLDDPSSNIRDMIAVSSNNDTIMLKPGLYNDFNDRNLDFQEVGVGQDPLSYTRNLVLMGEKGPDSTIMDVSNSGWFLKVENGESSSEIVGITIRNANSSAIHIASFSQLGIKNCRFEDNYNNNSTGGAIFAPYGDHHCAIAIENTVFTGNFASQAGGAILIAGGTDAKIVNSVFYDNSSNSQGGAIHVESDQSQVQIVNSLFFDNSAAIGSGAISRVSNPSLSVINSIFWENYQGATSSDMDNATIVDHCILQEGSVVIGLGNNFALDPMIVNPEEGDFSLSEYSPAIGFGLETYNDVYSGASNTPIPSQDLYGNPRPQPAGTIPDLGPIEHQRAEPRRWVYSVAPNGNDGNDGISAPFLTIQRAIDETDHFDTVQVAPGTYTGLGNVGLDFDGMDIVLRSESGPDATVIDMQSNGFAFDFYNNEPPSARVIGFTIQNGHNSGGDGGAIRIDNASPTFVRVKLVNNTTAQRGGAIYALNSGATFVNSVIAFNNATQAGGVAFIDGGDVTFMNCTIANNRSGNNTGIAMTGGSHTVHNSILWNNTVDGFELADGAGNSGQGFVAVNYSNVMEGVGGDNNVILRPGFTDGALGDFTLMDWSPMIGLADTAWFAPTDYYHVERTISDTTWPDLGAFEHANKEPDPTNYTGLDWYVDDDGSNDTGDGTAGSPFATLLYASHYALYDDTVRVEPGTYNQTVVIKDKPVHFVSTAGAAQTILDGAGQWRVMEFTNCGPDGIYLDGFTIQNGNDSNGAGIKMYNSSGVIRNSVINNNTAGSGAGLWAVTLDSSRVYYIVIENTDFTENTANSSNAGIRIQDMQTEITNCVFSNNTAARYSAFAVYGGLATLDMVDCHIFGNSAVEYAAGGGLFSNVTGTMTRVVITNNNANTGGGTNHSGGLSIWGGASLDMENCTIADNTAEYGAGLTVGGATAAVNNCIFWDNIPDQLALEVYDGVGGDLTVAYSIAAGGETAVYDTAEALNTLTWGAGNLDRDPWFVAADDYHLMAKSAAVNAGDPALTDDDGTRIDIGVYPYLNTYTGPVFHVDELGSDLDGTGAVASPFASPQAAVNFALDGDSVSLAAGSFTGTTILRDADLVFSGVNGETTLDGAGGGSVLTIPAGLTSATVIEDLIITGGMAEIGAGIYVDSSSPVIRRNIITGNEATTYGSAIYAEQTDALFEYNLAYGNTGDAVYLNNGAPVLVNNTIADNAGTGITVINPPAPIAVRNCIVWGNNSGLAGNLTTSYSDIEGLPAAGTNISDDPQFSDTANGDYSLALTSPAIDSGDPADSVDPDGSVRDMGAFPRYRNIVGGSTGGNDIVVSGDTATVVTSNLVVNAGDSLIVEPGAEIYVGNGVTVTIYGILAAPGSPGGPISFATLHAGDYFNGVLLQGGSSGREIPEYSYLTISDVADGQVPLTITESAVLNHVTIAGNDRSQNSVEAGGSLTLNYSIAESNVIDSGIPTINHSFVDDTTHFVSYSGGDFNLRVESAAIDTGMAEAGTNLDPDNTYSDAGAFYHDQSAYPTITAEVVYPPLGTTVEVDADSSTSIGMAVQAQLLNQWGRAKTNASVNWDFNTNNGSLDSITTAATDLDGFVDNIFYTNSLADAINNFTVESDGVTAISGDFVVQPGAPDSLALPVEFSQDTVMTQLDELVLAVDVYDQFANLVLADDTVHWTIVPVVGSGTGFSIAATLTFTDANGQATVTLNTNPNGLVVDDAVRLEAQSNGATVQTMLVTIVPDDIYNLSMPPALTDAVLELSADVATLEISATMIDTFDNPLPNVAVNWAVVSSDPDGAVSDASTLTDGSGEATVTLTTGTVTDYEYQVAAWVQEAALVTALTHNTANGMRAIGTSTITTSKGSVTRNLNIPVLSSNPITADNWSRESIFDLNDTTAVVRIIPGVPDAVTFDLAADTVMTQFDNLDFEVDVRDQFGNPVADSSVVTWSLNVLVGDATGCTFSSPTSTTTGGLATVTFSTDQSGVSVDELFQVVATCAGVESSSGNISIIPDHPYNMAVAGYEVAPVADDNTVPLSVTVIDTFDNALNNIPVHWEIIEGTGGSLINGAETVTDMTGQATNTLTTSTVSGSEYRVRIYVDNVGGYTATAFAGTKLSLDQLEAPGGRKPAKTVLETDIKSLVLNRSVFDLEDTTDVITVLPGAPVTIISEKPDTVYVVQSQTDTLEIDVFDQFGNLVSDGSPVLWNPTANIDFTIISQDSTTEDGKAELDLTASAMAAWLSQIDFAIEVQSIFDGNNAQKAFTYIVEDVIAPAAVSDLVIAPAGWTSTNYFDLSWTNPPEHSGVAGAHYDVAQTSSYYEAGQDIASLTGVAVDAEGISAVLIWLRDNAENEDVANAMSIDAKYDNSSPADFAHIYPQDNDWLNVEQPTFTWNASSDQVSGLREYRVVLDGNDHFVAPDDLAFMTSTLSEGHHTLTIFAVDSAYNETEMDNGQIGFDVDFTLPTITHNQVLEGTANSSVTITASFADPASGVARAELYYRKGGEMSWQNPVDMSTLPSYQVASSFVTSVGLEYYLEVEDVAGNINNKPAEGFYSVEVTVTGAGLSSTREWPTGIPNGTSVSNYQLLSFPGQPANATPTDVLVDDLGSYDNKKWRFFTYGTADWLEFADISSIEPGVAYFLIVKGAGNNIGTGQTRSVSTDELFQINLPAGDWAFIGNPFDFEIPLQNVFDQDSVSVEGNSNFYTWNGDWAGATKLDPWRGYIYKSADGGQLFIDPRKANGGTAKQVVQPAETIPDLLSEGEWLVDISVNNGAAADRDNLVGVLHSASDAYDAQVDRFEPPLVPGGVALRIDNRNWDENGDLYTSDLRQLNAEGQYWDMEVIAHDPTRNVRLLFNGVIDIPAEYDVFIIDKSVGSAQNLRGISDYSYAFGSVGSKRQLRLVAGTREFVEANSGGVALYPEAYTLGQNFPNPFNPKTNISISLEDAAVVDLVIYNILGEEVCTLARGKHLPIGYYNFIWSGRNNFGQRVASGVYIYVSRIESPSGKMLLNKTRKMVLVK